MKKTFIVTLCLSLFSVCSVAQQTTSFTDPRDGKTYKTVKIGRQVWMAQNLAYKPDRGIYWAYGNDTNNVPKYGFLYDWETAKKVCPKGWHLPSDKEWKTLEIQIGMSQTQADEVEFRGNEEGRKLKSTTDWSSNGNGTDDYGFSALPGGTVSFDGNFYEFGKCGFWWSSTEYNADTAWKRELIDCSNNVWRYYDSKYFGMSVRCIKN